jgi:hypothetical protein
MMPGLGDKFGAKIEIIEKPRDVYRSEAYTETKLPVAPAIMIDDDVIVVQSDITLSQLIKMIENRIKTNMKDVS